MGPFAWRPPLPEALRGKETVNLRDFLPQIIAAPAEPIPLKEQLWSRVYRLHLGRTRLFAAGTAASQLSA
jgi:hypothetical protein